ncbi:MAG: hypothetical protein RBS43_03705, partial [Candidatus Cloacimonas sp.]|nr:hypothetical protein [Candidatus Cloacimonas sp.]
MRKLFVLSLMILVSTLWAAKPVTVPIQNPADEAAFYPRLYIPDYTPLIYNRIEVYKIDKGLNIYRLKPYDIPAFAPEYKEQIDFPNQKITLSVKVGEYKIANDVPISFNNYFSNL